MQEIKKNWLVAAAALISILFVVKSYFILPFLPVFGHDEVPYYADITFKLNEEGRWITFLLYGFLRSIPAPVGAVLFLGVGWIAIYRLVNNYAKDRFYSIVIASAVVTAPTFVEEAPWPLTHLFDVATLLGLTFFVERTNKLAPVYIASGVLFFGMPQNYYFLTPLLFLGRYDGVSSKSAEFYKVLAWHAVYFVLGAVIGLIVSFVMLYLITGNWGVQVAEWRRVTPAHDLHALFNNVRYVIGHLRDDVSYLATQAASSERWLLALFMLWIAFRLLRHSSWNIADTMILIGVALSYYAFCVPMAPLIQTRTLIALSTSLIILAFFTKDDERWVRTTSCVLLTLATFGFSSHAYQYLNERYEQTSFIRAKIAGALDKQASNYRAIAVVGKVSNENAEATIVNTVEYLYPIVISLGAKDFWDCRTPREDCKPLLEKLPMKTANDRPYRLIGVYDGIAVIDLTE